MSVTEQSALQIAAVYGCVGVLCDSMATLPVDLFSSLDPATRRRLPPSQLVRQPYIEISRQDWIVQFTASLALRGNFFGQIVERDEDHYPTQIKPIHPDQARVRRVTSGKQAGRPEYRFNGQPVPIDDVFHVRFLSMPGMLEGLNPIQYLRVTLGLARAQEEYGASYFANSANPSGVITIEDDLDPEETVAVAQNWRAAHQGVGRANLPAVLTGGARFQAISITPQDSQFIQSRGYTEQEIVGRIFRIPPHMVGIQEKSTTWGRGIEEQARGFVTNTLAGYYTRYEESLTAIHPHSQYVRCDLSERLRGDLLARFQGYSLAIASGFMCQDDARAAEHLPPLPDGLGKTFLMPINAQSLRDAALRSIADSQQTPPSDGSNDEQGGGTNG